MNLKIHLFLRLLSSFFETFLFLENTIGDDSYQREQKVELESQRNHVVEKDEPMTHFNQTAQPAPMTAGKTADVSGPVVQMAQRKIVLGGTVSTRAEAEELITMINGLKPMLKGEEPAVAAGATPRDNSEII